MTIHPDELPSAQLTPLEYEILGVFGEVANGVWLGEALADLDESGHVAEWIVERIREVSPWIARRLAA